MALAQDMLKRLRDRLSQVPEDPFLNYSDTPASSQRVLGGDLPDAGQAVTELIEAAACSQRHRDEGLMASRAEMARGTAGMSSHTRPAVFGEKYWQRWVRSYPEIARRFHPGKME